MPEDLSVSRPGRDGQRGFRVLIVEDHQDTAGVLKYVLEARGCEVQTASTVAEALDILLKNSFDVLLSDVGLPDGDGVKLISAIRRFCATPAIALTAYDSPDDIACCLIAGFNLHIGKPVDIEKLYQQMCRLAG